MRGRSGQGSDRTGRAHPLTLLPFLMVLTMQGATLVRGSLRGPRLRAALLTLKFPTFSLTLMMIFLLVKPRPRS